MVRFFYETMIMAVVKFIRTRRP